MRQHRKRRIEPNPWRGTSLLARAALLAAAGAFVWQALGSSRWEHWLSELSPPAHAQENAADPPPKDADEAEPAAGPVTAYRFDVPLPITGLVDQQVESSVERALRKLPKDGPRPVFIFEFRPKPDTAGEGGDFGRALSLARFLAGDRLSQARTVAWVPKSVKGHGVLPVLACEQIVMDKDAELGAAGIDESSIDPTLRRGYSEIAERRRTVPAAIALGMLDKNLAVYKVTTLEGVRYETAEELPKLRESGVVSKEETIFQPGDEHVLSGQEMRHGFGFASHLAEDRRSLAAALQLPLNNLQQSLAPEEGWRPIRIDLNGPVHPKVVNWIARTIKDHQQRNDFNLLVLYLRSGGGNVEQSLRLAQQLASLGQQVHTVAYVDWQARGDAAIIALACDELIAHPAAVIGGEGEVAIGPGELAALREPLIDLAHSTGRDWSPTLALVDRNVELHRYTHALSNEIRYLSADEAASLIDADQWRRDDPPVETSRGITGQQAEEMGLARGTALNLDELRATYQIEGELEQMRPNWALAAIESLADPRIAWLLLFVGIFALMFEMSSPGVGLPGLIALVSFLLFFWSHFLHGTAGWLEILLFVAGIACLAIEILVLPGMGVFGIGGALMIIVSIVLASQTFIVPTNAYQLRQFPVSLLMVAAGMVGGLASIYVIRRFLPDTPYFNRMLLTPPKAEERAALSQRESLANWAHLAGKRGTTATPLVPAGKAQFGDELVDVVSTGDLVPKGSPVVVEEIIGSRVVVRRVIG
jgi:membrane-bound serine protease (ClpP class)